MPSDVHTLIPPVAVILAAGEGTRIQNGDSDVPKPLLKIRGLSLAERSIAQMWQIGINSFVIVLGSRADECRVEFKKVAKKRGCKINFVVAEDYMEGNGSSLLAVQNIVGNTPFIMTMVDHLLSRWMINKMLDNPPTDGTIALAIDSDVDNIFDIPDLTKINILRGQILNIGKDLTKWNAGDTGLFYCTSAIFEGLLRAKTLGNYSLTDGVIECMRKGKVQIIDLSGAKWIDVDTPEAISMAEKLIDQFPKDYR